MNITRHTVLYLIQISIIASAVVLTVLRLAAPYVDGYETQIEQWFDDQGINADIARIALRIDGLTPEITINGLLLKDKATQATITLNQATLYLDIAQSLLKQQFIIDRAELSLDKVVVNSALFLSANHQSPPFSLPPEAVHGLMGLKQLHISIGQIDFMDSAQKSYSIYQTGLSFVGDGADKQLHISSSLLQKKEAVLNARFSFDLTPLLNNKPLAGKGFLAFKTHALEQLNVADEWALSGAMTWYNWFEFQGRSISVLSHLKTRAVSFNIQDKTHQLDADSLWSTRFNEGAISVTANARKLLLNQHDLTTLNIKAQATVQDNSILEPQLLLENIALTTIQQLANDFVDTDVLTAYQALNPEGRVQQIFVRAPSLAQLSQWQMQLQADDLQWQAYQGIPSVDNVAIEVIASSTRFQARVSGQNMQVQLADHYIKPFQVAKLLARINGRIQADEFIMDIPHLSVQQETASIAGRLTLVAEQNVSPYLFMRLQATGADIKIVTPFLPQILMGDDVWQWVTSSVKQAHVTSADVLYAGRLENDVNFDVAYNGIFETALKLENVDLQFDDDWPGIQAPDVDLTFKNYQLYAHTQQAFSQGIQAQNIVFSIADLNQAKAHINVQVNDTLKKQWAYLKQSPIKDDIPYFSDVTSLTGTAKTVVEADFPLMEDEGFEADFKVTLKTQQAGFDIEPLGVSVRAISGDMLVTQEGVHVNPVDALWFDQPIKFNARYDNKATYLNLKGDQIDVATLLKTLPDETLKHISGKSTWDVNIAIFNDEQQTPVASIEAHSGLKGTAIHLPLPLTLDQEDTRYLKIEVDIFDTEDLIVQLLLDERVQTRFKLEKNAANEYVLWGANVQFGHGTVAEQITQGVHVKGVIEKLNIDHWLAYLSTDDKSSITPSILDPAFLTNLKSMDLSLTQAYVKHIEVKDVVLNVEQGETGLKGSIQSSVASGNFYYPLLQEKDVPVEIDLENFDIVLKEGLGKDDKTGYTTDQIPTFNFKSNVFVVNGKKFSDVHIAIESYRKNHFVLKTLSLKHQDIKLEASGDWILNDASNQHISHLKVAVTGEKLGQSLSALGLGNSIKNGQVAFSGNLTWPAAFWSLDFDQAKGSATIKIKDGYLLDVDPAAGRFVGLLSLSALPRRLTLDFSDFFKEGLEFDRITGDFLIHDGSMWTTNLNMTGSVSEVNIVGRTGLKAKDYDQMITIIPQVRDALPVIGSLVAGSSVGWAVLLFQRLFKDPIDDSVSIKYKVTGTWDKPHIELIEKPEEQQSNDVQN